jgi:hypothetical protein
MQQSKGKGVLANCILITNISTNTNININTNTNTNTSTSTC